MLKLWPRQAQFMIFIIWPSSVTLTFNLPKQIFKWHYYSSRRKPVQRYFEIHKYRSYGRDKLIYDHFIIWPSSVTLTSNLPKKKFQMTLLLLKDKNQGSHTPFWEWGWGL